MKLEAYSELLVALALIPISLPQNPVMDENPLTLDTGQCDIRVSRVCLLYVSSGTRSPTGPKGRVNSSIRWEHTVLNRDRSLTHGFAPRRTNHYTTEARAK